MFYRQSAVNQRSRFSTDIRGPVIFTLFEVFIVLVLLSLGWLIWQNTGMRDRAIALARQHCEGVDVQLLDDTVSLVKVRPTRHPKGHMALMRVYEFEFSVTGERRYQGQLILKGDRLAGAKLEPHRMM